LIKRVVNMLKKPLEESAFFRAAQIA